MSRNIRQKFPRTPAKATKRRGSNSSSSLNLSDDDGYSGVDDISDSEDDDEDGVDAAEEENIITHEARKSRTSGSPRPAQDDDEDADEEDDDENDEQMLDEDDADPSDGWEGIVSETEEAAPSHEAETNATHKASVDGRRVRFAGVPESDSDSTTSETTDDIDSVFPDIFVGKNDLDPSFRREIEQDPDDLSSNGSYWDFHDTYIRVTDYPDAHAFANDSFDADDVDLTPKDSQDPTAASTPVLSPEECQDLDGYETDGDTTEEDIPEPPARRKQSRPVQPAVGDSSDSETDRPIKFRRGRPRAARFDLDSAHVKPVAVMHPVSRKMIIFTPRKARGFDLSPESFREMDFFGLQDMTQSSPILSHSGSLMMGAMVSSNTFGDFIHSQQVGPVEAFFRPFNSDALVADDSDISGVLDEEEDDERDLKIEDFIKFDDQDASEDDHAMVDGESPDWEDDTNAGSAVTPDRRSSMALSTDTDMDTEMHPLFAHFDNNSDKVGAFRRNQVNKQLILSEKASSESLAFSGPYTVGTLRGIKNGSLENVTAPITPVRRQKRGSMNGLNDRSPLEAVSQKRKASGAPSGGIHKRHRSISDVRDIAL